MEPTIAHHSTSSSHPDDGSIDVSKANVGFVAGDRPKFADETTKLLRSRLAAAAVVLLVVFAAAFVGSLVSGIVTLLWLRAVILGILLACLLTLRSSRHLSLAHLRTMEVVVFGLVLGQVSLMIAARIAGFAARDDATSVVALQYLYLGAWCLLLLIYGIFVPNTWKRAAAVMLPVSLLPYVVMAIQRWSLPELAALLEENNASSPVPLPVVAALVGIYGTHVINSARREAFKARQFGQYRLLERLGSGGMGEVFKAEHVLLKRPCAMKLIKPSSETDATAIAHFEKEVKATAKLTHWNTVEIYDYGRTEDGTFYYVMELLPGMSLEELVDEYGPLPPERVVHLVRQVCGALQEAHSVGLIHRDIKTANIFSANRGGVFDVAKLLDFGLVKEQTKGNMEARHGSFSGTPLYMSPEQAAAYEDVDGRADLYSLGAVAYHLLVGQPPFTGKNVIELLAAHANSEVTAPSQINTGVPSDLGDIVLRCLAKNPNDRFPDATSLEQALAGCSCANQWSEARSHEWWSARKQTQEQKPRVGPEQLDVTVVYSSTKTLGGEEP